MNHVSVENKNIPDILIVDDVPANLKVLGDILKGEGYKVRPVPNGALALKVAEKEKPDLILLDIMMPDMDGYEVCRRLKEMEDLKDIPVIFISALNDTKDIVKALQSGAVDFITKPFQSEEIAARVNTHLKLHRQSIMLREQSKQLQELNASKDKLFSIIAHDLRGPLGGFMGLAEMIADESQPLTSDEKKDMIQVLSRSARNIYQLLENLLEWSQMQQGHTAFSPRLTSLKKLVTDSTKMLMEVSRKKNIGITVEVDTEQEVFADKNMIQSVVRNLVSNAIKFTPKGGRIIITADLTENNTSVITVKDTGIGMSSELVSNLFHINVNSSRPGTEGENSTGLGLLLCKEFVERHGGEIWVESEEEKGSLFCFTLPNPTAIKEETADPKITASVYETGHFKNLKVLIAEDNENSELLIRIVISPFSHQVLEAGTGSAAVEICRKNPDIDLVLMDINMPEMDGLEATRQIRKFNTDMVIIAQTAFGQIGSREKALEAGCNDYIAKPIEVGTLLGMIKRHFKISPVTH
ncbi:MAG: response regulator [Bacteroidales bacterium]|nr:response regulator [Bacteroidales bacterium]